MYKHLDLLEQLTEVARTNDKPWEEFDLRAGVNTSNWFDVNNMTSFFKYIGRGYVWQRKPKAEKQILEEFGRWLCDDMEDKLLAACGPRSLSTSNLMHKAMITKMAKRIRWYIDKYTPEPEKTVTINGVKLKDDRYTVDDLPEKKQRVYIEAPSTKDFYYNYIWGFEPIENAMHIERGTAHKTKEGAAAFTKASLKRG